MSAALEDLVTIEAPASANLLAHFLRSLMLQNLAGAGPRKKLAKMTAVVAIQAGRMQATLCIGGGRIHIAPGFDEGADCGVRGTLGGFLEIALGRPPVQDLLRRGFHIQGNPLHLVRLLPLLSARMPAPEAQALIAGARRDVPAPPVAPEPPPGFRGVGPEPTPAHRALEAAIGPDPLIRDPAWLAPYAGDRTEAAERTAGLIIRARSHEDVVAVMRVAHDFAIPVTPRVAGTNMGGLTVPERGGWILDLSAMSRVLEYNRDEMYVMIEPGVTFGQLAEYLDERGAEHDIGYPLSPPWSSVLANCLLDGLANLSLRYGPSGQWINGLEVVLPGGETARTGSCAVSDSWFSRSPLPDLTGLFVSWQGTTGIATRGAVQVFPRAKRRTRYFIMVYRMEDAFKMMRRLAPMALCNDVGGLGWPTAKMLYGQMKPQRPDVNEPEFFLYMDIGAETAEEMYFKRWQLGRLMDEFRRQGIAAEDPMSIEQLVRVEPKFIKFAKFPTTLDFLLDYPGGGLTWVGTYGPMSRFEGASREANAIYERHGFAPTIVSRPMQGGHFGVLRYIAVFDKSDPDEVRRITAANQELGSALIGRGFVVYKAPQWAVTQMRNHGDPGFFRLMGKIRAAVDPKGILNPGRW